MFLQVEQQDLAQEVATVSGQFRQNLEELVEGIIQNRGNILWGLFLIIVVVLLAKISLKVVSWATGHTLKSPKYQSDTAAAKRTRDARPYGGIAAPIRSAKAYWRCWFVCLRRGTFRAVRSSQNAPGAAAPDPFGAVRRTSQGEASPRPLRSTGPSRPILPAPSRLRAGQENRTIVTATELSSKAARTAPEQGFDFARGSVTTPQSRLCRD